MGRAVILALGLIGVIGYSASCMSGGSDIEDFVCPYGAEPNECGGCAELDAAPGDSCGACGGGTYACDEADADGDKWRLTAG